MNLNLKKEIDYWVGGLCLILLYPAVRLAALLLRRDHKLVFPRHICFVKLLGGGNLLMLLPVLQALKEMYPRTKFSLVCSSSIKNFAEAYGVFDTVQVIDDKNILKMLLSATRILFWLGRNVDTSIDLEVHSRLTSVFTTISLVKNRVGLVDQDSLWRQRIYTHAIYMNPYHAAFDYYDAIGLLFDIKLMSVKRAQNDFILDISQLNVGNIPSNYYTVGVGCSDLAVERMIPNEDWAKLLTQISLIEPDRKFVFLGARRDFDIAKEILKLVPHLAGRCFNYCGLLELKDSTRVILSSDCYLGIDSGLLHLARFVGVPSVSFWGPTKADSLLRPLCVKDLQISREIACSPCVHFTDIPPCKGQNICNQHTNSFPRVIHFLKTLSIVPARPATLRQNDIWLYYPDSKIPKHASLSVQYS